MKITRREAIVATVGLVVGTVTPVPELYASHNRKDWQTLARDAAAEFVADWEISALRHNCPNGWQRFKYTSGCQWSKPKGIFVIFGVGPPEHCINEFAFHCEQWEQQGNVLDRHIMDDHCAWALTLRGILSDRLREDLRTTRPSFGHVPFDANESSGF